MAFFVRFTTRAVAAAVLMLASAAAGPFDAHVGKYKGSGIESGSDGSTYRFNQTVKLENSTQRLTTTVPGIATAREFIQYRRNGRIAGSGSITVNGVYISWTVSGTWKQEGDLIKGRSVTTHHDGSSVTARYVHKFEDGKLKMNARGSSSDGYTYTSTYTGKLVEPAAVAGAE